MAVKSPVVIAMPWSNILIEFRRRRARGEVRRGFHREQWEQNGPCGNTSGNRRILQKSLKI